MFFLVPCILTIQRWVMIKLFGHFVGTNRQRFLTNELLIYYDFVSSDLYGNAACEKNMAAIRNQTWVLHITV
jgi:hypothetical protein